MRSCESTRPPSIVRALTPATEARAALGNWIESLGFGVLVEFYMPGFRNSELSDLAHSGLGDLVI